MTVCEGSTTTTCLERRSTSEPRRLRFINPWITVSAPKLYIDEHGLFSPRFKMTLSTRKRSVTTMAEEIKTEIHVQDKPKKLLKTQNKTLLRRKSFSGFRKDSIAQREPQPKIVELPEEEQEQEQEPQSFDTLMMLSKKVPTPAVGCSLHIQNPWQMQCVQRSRMGSISMAKIH